MNINWIVVGAIAGASAVALGAFGAHALQSQLSEDLLGVFETGVRYQMYHAVALLAVAWVAERRPSRWVNFSGWLFTVGILIFSGTLYLLAFSGARWLGAVTPIGGLCLILAWVSLAIAASRNR